MRNSDIIGLRLAVRGIRSKRSLRLGPVCDAVAVGRDAGAVVVVHNINERMSGAE